MMYVLNFKNVVLAVFACGFLTVIESAKILSIFTIPSRSHYIYASALLKELAARGHEITSVNTYPQKTAIPNFRDVFIENNTGILKDYFKTLEQKHSFPTAEMPDFFKAINTMCVNNFENPEFQELMRAPEGKFDLIILEVIFSDSLNGLGQHFKAPMIGVSTFGAILGIDNVVGNTSPVAAYPNENFIGRLFNLIVHIALYFQFNFISVLEQRKLYAKYFPNASLTYDEASTNVSLLLLNQHHTLNFPRPYVPNVIEAGGLHIKHNPDPLPEDLQTFLDNATEGVVYFSMGSNLKSKDWPLEKRMIFINVFSKLKEKVLWKFEDSNLPNKPDNVFIKSWYPQHAILNHPNVKVFITHGGLLSTTEAVFFATPMLGIPMFGDQMLNILMAVKKEICLSVDFHSLTEEDLEHALNELLHNKKYAENMKAASSQFHDKPMTAMETAIFWVDYVLRHKGAPHLRNAGADLNILQYYSVDVISVILIPGILALILSFWILKKIFILIRKINTNFKSNEKKLKTK